MKVARTVLLLVSLSLHPTPAVKVVQMSHKHKGHPANAAALGSLQHINESLWEETMKDASSMLMSKNRDGKQYAALDAYPFSTCGVHRVAVLLVGSSKPARFDLHGPAIMQRVVLPLKADVFAVFEETGPGVELVQGEAKVPLAQALEEVLGSSLRSVGLVQERRQLRYVKHFTNNTTEYHLIPYGMTSENAHKQWYKYFESFKLMAEFEGRYGFKYDAVIKLRFDCTPGLHWNLCESEAMTRNDFTAVHACTDHVFWGRREVMAVAALIWPAIDNYFKAERPNPMARETSTSAMIESLLAVPQETWELGYGATVWKHYNKIGALPYLDMGQGTATIEDGGYKKMIDNLEKAQSLDIDYIDPLALPNVVLRRGIQSHPHDYTTGSFITEKDFLTWMLKFNITCCDLGAGTMSVLYKGVEVRRKSQKCKKHLESGAPLDPKHAPRSGPAWLDKDSSDEALLFVPLPPPLTPPPPLNDPNLPSNATDVHRKA